MLHNYSSQLFQESVDHTPDPLENLLSSEEFSADSSK